MAYPAEGDTNVQYWGLLVPALITFIAGLLIHSFIIAVNVGNWWKGKLMAPVDHIVTSLGLSRMCAQCLITLFTFLGTLFLSSMDSPITMGIILALYFIFFSANFWLTSLLSIVLCLKISNFHSRLFLYLRGMIARRTVYFIVGSVLLSVFSLLMANFIIIDVTKSATYNTTVHNLSMDCTTGGSMYNFIIGPFFSCLIYFISSVLLFTSLYQHITKMKMSTNLSISLESYYSVMRLISVTFIYNTLYFIGHLTFHLYYFFYCESLPWLFIVLEFLPVLHSSYLIYRTAKLRSRMSKVLQNVTSFLIQRKDTETRENIEIISL